MGARLCDAAPRSVAFGLGQSPAGLSATGESDVRNYYDMIAARQEVDLRPQLERLDALMLRSEGLDPDAMTFAFRPLWQLDEPARAALALAKARATQVYADLGLWPADVMARLVEAQLVADGTYPNAAAVFAEATATLGRASPALDFDPAQPRDPDGRWTAGQGATAPAEVPVVTQAVVVPKRPASHKAGGSFGLLGMLNPIGMARAQEIDPEKEENRDPTEAEASEPGSLLRISRYRMAEEVLRTIEPNSRELGGWKPIGYIPTESDVERVEGAARDAAIVRTCDFLRPDGKPIGEPGTSSKIRVLPGGLEAAQRDFNYLSLNGTPLPVSKGSMARLPYAAGTVVLRPVTSTPGSPAVDIKIPDVIEMKLHYWSGP